MPIMTDDGRVNVALLLEILREMESRLNWCFEAEKFLIQAGIPTSWAAGVEEGGCTCRKVCRPVLEAEYGPRLMPVAETPKTIAADLAREAWSVARLEIFPGFYRERLDHELSCA